MISRTKRAFTLIEILLAVGAGAIIAVGIAAVFAATGDVVRGGRRVSRFGQYASQVEVQIRQDIGQMTRDGYLLIRNELALNDQKVALYDGQPALRKRSRRIDELMFFTNGDYASAREALLPGYIARSNVARIYYGHGMPVNPLAPPPADDAYKIPELSDVFSNGGGSLDAKSVFGEKLLLNPNPLEFASDWTLLRHVLLLAQPGHTVTDPPVGPPYPLGLNDPNLFEDEDQQIALQPAVSYAFRAITSVMFGSATTIRLDYNPQIPSGLVDIATTDLREIQSVIVGMQQAPAAGHQPIFPDDITTETDFLNARRDWAPPPLNLSVDDDLDKLAAVQSWMLEGLPAFSHADAWYQRVRMRSEPTAPNYMGVLADPPDADQYPDAEEVYRAADQMMLTASNFVPHCSEFIVEWSFGEVYPQGHQRAGQTVWHGLERRVDINGDLDPNNDPLVAVPYDASAPDFLAFRHLVPYRLRTGDSFGSYPAGGVIPGGLGGGIGGGGLGVSPKETYLIHGANFDADIDGGKQLFSYFGYHDPTFDPDDPLRNGLNNGDESLADSLPWPWPKLLRVTLSLADPNDPSIEETFQFVVEMPGDPDP
jgi:hypothetical protein